jgi:hypothetical protein
MKRIISAFALAGMFVMTSCNNSAMREKEAALQAQQHTIDSMNAELARKRVIDSMNEITKTQYLLPPAATPTSPGPVVRSESRSTRHTHAAHTNSRTSQPVVQQQAPAEQHKKGWSAKAKGAVIGTAAGAAAGAIINRRNPAVGAVIGGVLGAGAGTGVGAVIDKKHGR